MKLSCKHINILGDPQENTSMCSGEHSCDSRFNNLGESFIQQADFHREKSKYLVENNFRIQKMC